MPASLTDELIADILAANPAPDEVTDTTRPGLKLEFGQDRALWFFAAGGDTGETIRMELGSWPTISVARARSLSDALRTTIEAVTSDPHLALTVGVLLDRYTARRLPSLRRGGELGRSLQRTLGQFSDRTVESLSRREIGQVIDSICDRSPIAANHALAEVKCLFNWAIGRGYIDVNPAASLVAPGVQRPRDRTPSLDEIADIWRAAGWLGWPFGPIVQLLILTASRRSEVAALRLQELFLDESADEGWWVIPAERSKNGRSIRVPLAPLAREILRKAIEARAEDGSLIFSATGTTPVSAFSRSKVRLDQYISELRNRRRDPPMPPWRLHDLRRTFATHACDVLNVPPAVADRCLNHVGTATSSTIARVYARNEMFDQRREALEKWAQLVIATVDRTNTGDVSRPKAARRNPGGRPARAKGARPGG